MHFLSPTQPIPNMEKRAKMDPQDPGGTWRIIFELNQAFLDTLMIYLLMFLVKYFTSVIY